MTPPRVEPEPFVTLSDGTHFADAALVNAERAFHRKIVQEPGHIIMVTWDINSPGYQPIQYSIQCSCGINQGWGWKDRGLNVDSSMPKKSIMLANSHIIDVQRDKDYHRGASQFPEPRLIAKVKMARVTHEWWVAHMDTDLIIEVLYPKGHNQPISAQWPWKVLQRNSHRYKFIQSHRTQEQAVAAVLKYVERERYRGHDVEILDEEMTVGIEAPAATIASSVRRLIDESKGLGKNPAPHKVAAILRATDDGLAQLELLGGLREELRNRFGQALDLG